VSGTLAEGSVPLALGGDHSIAIGSLVGSARDAGDRRGVVRRSRRPQHARDDALRERPRDAARGRARPRRVRGSDWATAPGLNPENVALVGLRSVDDAEIDVIRDHGFAAYTMSDIDDRGITDVTEEAMAEASAGVDGVHVSLDLDWLDPREAPGVGTPVRGGVTYREAHRAMESVAETDCVRSMELVEVNPTLDQHNETAELATELAASAFGKRVL